jgi:hypothetical protein
MLTFFYFGTSSGMVFKLHQCLESFSIFAGNSEQTCSICKTKKKKDCCKTQFKIVKTSPAYKADLLKIDLLKYAAVPQSIHLNPVFKISSADDSCVRVNAPPDQREVAFFIRDCNFRI